MLSKRNYGIDLLRMISMFMICLLHVLKQGGILARVSMTSDVGKFFVAWIIEICAYCAVNVFAMISGYVGIKSKFRISRPLSLWVEIIFYTIIITSIFICCSKKVTNFQEIWLNAFFPVMKGQYWYITAYMGLVIFSPLLNIAINKIDIRALSCIVIAAFIFACLIPAIMNVNVFSLASGYTMAWLIIMYIFGGYFARIQEYIKIKKLLIYLISIGVFAISVTITYVFKINNYNRLVDYTSPTIVLTGISLLFIYSNINFKEDSKVGRAISFLSSSSLAVYLIHVHPLVWKNCILNFAKLYVKSDAWLMGLRVLWAALLIFLGCMAIDLVRRFIFWAIRFKPLMKKVDLLGNKIIHIGEKKVTSE